jgi:hypothetical protein
MRPGAPAGPRFSLSGIYVTLFIDRARSLNRQHVSEIAGFAAAMIAAAAFIGWWVSLPLLSSWGSGFATVKPTVALSLVALGVALVQPGKNSRLAFVVGLAVAAIPALDLLDQFGIDLGINYLNRLLVPQASLLGHETSFRMINGVPLALRKISLRRHRARHSCRRHASVRSARLPESAAVHSMARSGCPRG